jgi:hypothetical protein
LTQSRLAGDHNSQLIQKYSAPVGILCLIPSDLKKICKTHINQMIENGKYVSQTTAADVTQLPAEILYIIQKYCASKDVRPETQRFCSMLTYS